MLPGYATVMSLRTSARPRLAPVAWTALLPSPLAITFGLVVLFSLAFALRSVSRYDTFRAGKDDLDIQGQVVWNTAHGHPFSSTVLSDNETMLAEHLSFSLIPLALFQAAIPDPRMILVAQSI